MEAATAAPAEGAQILLFNQKFEGQRVVDYALNFGGNIPLGDKALIEALRIDGDATLVVKVKVVSRSHKVKKGKDGGVIGVVSSSNVTVESVALDESLPAA